MRLNQATDYAMRVILYFASKPQGQVVEAKLISEQEHIPMRFLLKFLRQLVKAGLINSHRGTNGGYSLARPAKEISMLDVFEAMEGPLNINRCLYSPEECSKKFAGKCPVHEVLGELQGQMKIFLAKYDFEMLSQRVK
ncbi:Rrf2 family transcriptional regulator [Bacillota bacterium LX-D]|nr:Rrf2 family transcriptional regulator [Bacillota bacterium LX-D]